MHSHQYNWIKKTTESTYGENSLVIVAPIGCAANNIKGKDTLDTEIEF